MTNLTEFHMDIMRKAVEEAAEFLSIEISQLNVFLPERQDDLDMIDRVTFRLVIDETNKFVAGKINISIYETEDISEARLVKMCRICAADALINKEHKKNEVWIREDDKT